VFLLTGMGALLSVLAARLGCIVDRLRIVNGKLADAAEDVRFEIDTEKSSLTRRAHLINWAISLCTTCALFICAVIATLFIGSLLGVSVAGTIALMFIAAMLALIVGLIFFLREVYLATDSIYFSVLLCNCWCLSKHSPLPQGEGWVRGSNKKTSYSLILPFYPKGHKSRREKGRSSKHTGMRIVQHKFQDERSSTLVFAVCTAY
jgi:Protein of unknown function (DUF2721)